MKDKKNTQKNNKYINYIMTTITNIKTIGKGIRKNEPKFWRC